MNQPRFDVEFENQGSDFMSLATCEKRNESKGRCRLIAETKTVSNSPMLLTFLLNYDSACHRLPHFSVEPSDLISGKQNSV